MIHFNDKVFIVSKVKYNCLIQIKNALHLLVSYWLENIKYLKLDEISNQ
jgi:hypothetical protein